MARSRKQLLMGLIASLALVLIAATASIVAPDQPATPTLALDSRLVVLAPGNTPVPAYLDSLAYAAVPPPIRPASDPLQTPGANRRYPYGIAFTLNINQVWTAAPTGCDANGDNCASLGFNWSSYHSAIDAQRAYQVTYADGSTGPSPVALYLPPTYLDFATDLGCGVSTCGSEATPCNCLYWPTNSTVAPFKIKFHNKYVDGAAVNTAGYWYWTLKYDDPKLLNYMKQMMYEAADEFAGDVDVVIVGPGFQRETQPAKMTSGDPNGSKILLSHETYSGVTCGEYRDFVRKLAEYAYDAFSPLGVDVQIAAGAKPCSSGTVRGWLSDLHNASSTGWRVVAPNKKIGWSLNNNRPDIAGGSGEPTWNNWQYNWFSSGQYNESIGWSQSYESGANPAKVTPPAVVSAFGTKVPDNANEPDHYGYLYWSHLTQAGSGVTHFRDNRNWVPYQSALSWEVVDKKVGARPEYLSYVFRRAEFPIFVSAGQTAQGQSGIDGGWSFWLSLPNYREYETACASWFQSQSATRNAVAQGQGAVTWLVCRRLANQNIAATPTYVPLPTPANTPYPVATPDNMTDLYRRALDRQAQVLETSGTKGEYDLLLDADHPWYGQAKNVKVRLRYLDSGTGSFTISLPGDTRSITRGNTGIWKESSYTVNNISFSNALTSSQRAGQWFAVISNSGENAYIHELALDVVGSSSATVTPTPTASRTPTMTPTPTATATPTHTPIPSYPAGVRFNEISAAELADWNLSGAVSAADRWFELINWTTSAVDLAGWRVSNGTVSHTFTDGSAIIPPYRAQLYLAEDTLPIPSSGTLSLYNPQSTPIATLTYSSQPVGSCYAALPNGSTSWSTTQSCTPGRENHP